MDQNFNRQSAMPPTEQPSTFIPQTTGLPPSPVAPPKKPTSGSAVNKQTIFIILLFLVIALAVATLFVTIKKADEQATRTANVEKRLAAIEEEDKYTEKQVDKDHYQAVFLSANDSNNTSTYFGKITAITKDTLKLEDIYYLQKGAVDKAGNPTGTQELSLIKLGKELHAPADVMFIERKNLSFWENLQADGQVSKAIADHKARQ